MHSRKNTFLIFVFLMICSFGQAINAQTPADVDNATATCEPTGRSGTFIFTDWLNCKVQEQVTAKINQSGTNKQVQTPSIADATTSLVDQTEGPDLAGLAMNLASLGSGSDNTSKDAFSVTTSAYAFFAATTRNDPLDPTFYTKNTNLRRFSFTLGREAPSENDSGSQTKGATLVGFKVLLLNRRDASTDSNRKKLYAVANALKAATVDFANMSAEVRDYLYDQFASTLSLPMPAVPADRLTFRTTHLNVNAQFVSLISQLTDDQKEEINKIIANRINSHVALQQTNLDVIEQIRRRPQLSFSFNSKTRSGDGDNEYRTGLIYDFGIPGRINFALNGTFDYKDSKVIGGDTRGGRFATELYYQPVGESNPFGAKDPILLSFSGEGKWMSNVRPTYVGQFKLNIPIRFIDGINIPLSVSYSNRKDLINEAKIRGKFGVTFDFAKILKGFKK